MPPRPDALFHTQSRTFHPTEFARGPWSPDALHGGAVAALVAHAVERHEADPAFFVARTTVEFERVVPMADLEVAVETIRPGRRVQALDTAVSVAGTVVARARSVRIRRRAADDLLAVDAVTLPNPEPAGPETARESTWRRDPTETWTALLHATEVRNVRGEFGVPGPASAWFRLTVPIVAGTELSPLERVYAVADFGSGVGSPVNFAEWLYINPELTVHLTREARGEWVLIDSGSLADSTGVALSETGISDTSGRIGRATASVLLDELPRD